MERPSNISLSTVLAFLAFTAFALISVVQLNRDLSGFLTWLNLALGVTGMVIAGIQAIRQHRKRPAVA